MTELFPYMSVLGFVLIFVTAVVAATWLICRTVSNTLEGIRRESVEFRFQIVKEIRESREQSNQQLQEIRVESNQQLREIREEIKRQFSEFREESSQKLREIRMESNQQLVEIREESKQQFVEFREQTKEDTTKLLEFVDVKFEEFIALLVKCGVRNQQEHQQLILSIDELANLIKNEHKDAN